MEGMIAERKDSPLASPVEWAVGARAFPGEIESGDLHLVAHFAEGVLIAVMDGLGHGPQAADAARVAASTLLHEPYESVTNLMQRCHAALRKTRGVVLSLASIDAEANLMTWLGVGNVDGALFRADRSARESIPQRSGVVGYELPALRATKLPIARGDTLIFVTDGISSDFSAESWLDGHPQQIADHILSRYAKASDDALVLVARYLGGAS
jgi:negative regulator of sigma-B (phosphoserine phosphatase)